MQISQAERTEFETYVWSFYGLAGVFEDMFHPPITKAEITAATDTLLAHYDIASAWSFVGPLFGYTQGWGYTDGHPEASSVVASGIELNRTNPPTQFGSGSVEREIVRDIILRARGMALTELEYAELFPLIEAAESSP